MHIPDGYLSPTTCAATYALALPVWYLAFAKLQRLLHTRTVPLIAVFSAFSFVIMMFNLPLPGGTTGHAVGMAIAAIVLGPWASVVAISIALLIQAVFFGDGGITSYGANCLNMAIVGSWVAHWIYQLVAKGAAAGPTRRIFAAGLAGYVAINAAALLTAVEFGIQPMFFHDASGTPLYAPYPLGIAIPAMMIGHVTFAGLAELVISAGLVAYLQRANPELLGAAARPGGTHAQGGRSARALWYMLAGLMILSPLGLLAAGTAWGEWSAEDFADAQARQEMLLASANAAPPADVPQGLKALSGLWSAPIPDYAPSFMHSAHFGYMLSAIVGCGLILLTFLLLSRFRAKKELAPSQQ
ncbi:cobalt transporter CbiM [Uliginosibacterium gangwonense]|uniref:cobalt transporter CbiM n=1 Tax=Uliginosibacterium gangwonense TaxID=392736 RepID=UPI00038292FC|nr:cobalt transporter CbiM [Uliginosibacterium gangwonense]